MRIQETMDLYDKLQILTDAAKYDVACTSSGADRKGDGTGMGSCERAGICHSFSADGRCISLFEDFIYLMNVFTTVNIVSTAGPMMCRGLPLRRTRSVH